MKRRSNREGSIYQRPDGNWVAAVTIPGSRRRLTKKAKTKALAVLKLCQLRKRVSGPVVEASDVTVRKCVDLWLDSLDIAPTTRATYRHNARHIGPLMEVKIQRLTKIMIETWLTKLKASAGKRTVQAAAVAFRSVCAYATTFDLIIANPFVSKVPTAKPKDIDVFSVDEVQSILGRFDGRRHEVVGYLAFVCALRQGEIFGLQWGDIDFTARTLGVRRQIVEHGRDQAKWIRVPKTKSSIRTIIIPEIAVEALYRRRVKALAEGQCKQTDFIVTTPRAGLVIRRCQFAARLWKPLLADTRPKSRKKNNPPPTHIPNPIRHRGLHHARHTAASIMLQNGVPLTEVSQFLGHANPTITARLYAHAMPGSGHRAAKSMDQALNCFRVAVSPPELRIAEAS